jgi:FKBP12-rapamycin complex-associated protein
VARELFAAGFVSCWSELSDTFQEQLVRSLEAAFASPTIPPEIISTLLNLAEFMEHDEKPLPVDIRTLGALAEKCRAFAKALHYKETEFQQHPASTVEALISINNQLQQPEAAVGILTYAQQHLSLELKESWYEKLQRWDEALEAYQRKRATTESGHPAAVKLVLGEMRCLNALAEWEHLSRLCREFWPLVDNQARAAMAPLAAQAAWNMGLWDDMEVYVRNLDHGLSHNSQQAMDQWNNSGWTMQNDETGSVDARSSLGAFFSAALHAHYGRYQLATSQVERARMLLGTELSALVGESYERAYGAMVRVQQLTELEEVITYGLLGHQIANHAGDAVTAESRRTLVRSMWRERIRGVQRKVEVWQGLLAVRSLVLPMKEESDTWIKFASLLQKSGRVRQCNRVLQQLLQYDPMGITDPLQAGYGAGSGAPNVMLAYLKYLWTTGDTAMRHEAFARIQSLVGELAAQSQQQQQAQQQGGTVMQGWDVAKNNQLVARAYLKMGTWQWGLCETVDDNVIYECLASLRAATEHGHQWGKAWHQWALFNAAAMEHYAKTDPAQAIRHVSPAVSGFFSSIALKGSNKRRGGCLQDILRLLTLWFNHGAAAEVERALEDGFQHVSIDTWLVVIPQIIARIHSPSPPVRNLIHSLLIRIGRHHPQVITCFPFSCIPCLLNPPAVY